jgi:hypothetical protein
MGRRDGTRANKERAPAAGGRGKAVGVTGVTVTDRMLIDAGLSRQHRDSRNSIAVTFLQKPNLGHHSRHQQTTS